MRSASVAPDLSSASERVSDTVSTAMRSGTNALLSSTPGIGEPRCRAATSDVVRPERVAGGDVALFQPGREPALALRGGTVGEGVRHHAAGRLALQRVVADRG